MTPIKHILAPYNSLYEAQKHLEVHRCQLKRWLDTGALVDDNGNVWIKTKGNVYSSTTKEEK